MTFDRAAAERAIRDARDENNGMSRWVARNLEAALTEINRLVQERDRMLAVPEREWTVEEHNSTGVSSSYIEGWNDALGAIARARSGS